MEYESSVSTFILLFDQQLKIDTIFQVFIFKYHYLQTTFLQESKPQDQSFSSNNAQILEWKQQNHSRVVRSNVSFDSKHTGTAWAWTWKFRIGCMVLMHRRKVDVVSSDRFEGGQSWRKTKGWKPTLFPRKRKPRMSFAALIHEVGIKRRLISIGERKVGRKKRG